jgi:hypothetical protein
MMDLSNSDAELEHLADQWLVTKEAEREANAARLRIEDKILKLCPAREEGSSTRLLYNGYKIKTTAKLIYKVDLDQLVTLSGDWPQDLQPFKTEIKQDDAVLKHLRADRPDLWRLIAPAVTTKPAKTGITIEDF